MDSQFDGNKGREIYRIRNHADLENKLSQPINLNTDIMEFLMIARCGRRGSNPLYWRANKKVREELTQFYNFRRTTLSYETKQREGMLMGSLVSSYYRGEFRTIGELKNAIEERGFIYPRIGPGAIATLNTIIKRYGLGAIKAKGHFGGRNYLKRFGLELVSDYAG